MIRFEADSPQNLFTIRYSGAIAAQETERGLAEIRLGLAN